LKTWIVTHFNSLLIAIIALLTPIKPLLLTVGFLIAVDFIFGLMRAYKLKEKITSRKASNTISKMVLYTLCVLSVFFLDKYILETTLNLAKIVAGFISLVEIQSILETFEIMTGINIWDRLVKIVKRGTSETKDLLDEIENKEDKDETRN
jgi:fumarate reductase subunit D